MAVAPMGSAPANTYVETTAVGVKEDLADIIYRIDPDETPLLSALPRVGSKQVMTEWIVQELNPATDNAQPEGFTAVDAGSIEAGPAEQYLPDPCPHRGRVQHAAGRGCGRR